MKKYKPAVTLRDQIEFLSSSYLRHGSKKNHRKLVENLITACESIRCKFGCKDVRQIGQKQIHWHDQQLQQSGFAYKTRKDYWYGWCQLWAWLNRAGKPNEPKNLNI